MPTSRPQGRSVAESTAQYPPALPGLLRQVTREVFMTLLKTLRIHGFLLALAAAPLAACAAAEPAVSIPAPVVDAPKAAGPTKKAVIAGGCFWGVQGVFQHMKGVRNVLSGYSGGLASTAKYELITAGEDRKSTRLNSSHSQISYAVFCL